MATDNYEKLAQVQPNTTPTTLYAPSSGTAIIRHIRAVNTNGSTAYTLNLYDGGSALSNAILGTVTIAAQSTYTDDCYMPVAAGGTVYAVASLGTQITVTAYGVRLT